MYVRTRTNYVGSVVYYGGLIPKSQDLRAWWVYVGCGSIIFARDKYTDDLINFALRDKRLTDDLIDFAATQSEIYQIIWQMQSRSLCADWY